MVLLIDQLVKTRKRSLTKIIQLRTFPPQWSNFRPTLKIQFLKAQTQELGTIKFVNGATLEKLKEIIPNEVYEMLLQSGIISIKELIGHMT